MATLVEEVKRMVEAGNFVGAGILIHESETSERERIESVGIAVEAVVAALETAKKGERVSYLRSVLTWLLREAPGLSHLYREQLKLSVDRRPVWQDLGALVRLFSDLGAAKPSAAEHSGGGADAGGAANARGPGVGSGSGGDAAGNANDFAEQFKKKSDEAQEQVREFFSQSGIDLDEGLRRAGEFFESLSGKPPNRERSERDTEKE